MGGKQVDQASLKRPGEGAARPVRVDEGDLRAHSRHVVRRPAAERARADDDDVARETSGGQRSSEAGL